MDRWSEWMKSHEAVQHLGHPDVFNFDYVYGDFAWSSWLVCLLQTLKFVLFGVPVYFSWINTVPSQIVSSIHSTGNGSDIGKTIVYWEEYDGWQGEGPQQGGNRGGTSQMVSWFLGCIIHRFGYKEFRSKQYGSSIVGFLMLRCNSLDSRWIWCCSVDANRRYDCLTRFTTRW